MKPRDAGRVVAGEDRGRRDMDITRGYNIISNISAFDLISDVSGWGGIGVDVNGRGGIWRGDLCGDDHDGGIGAGAV
jgi:hypothetical protein